MCTLVQYTESTRDAPYEYGVTTSSVQFSSIVEKLYQIIISNTQATENFISLVKRNKGSFTNKKFNVNSSIFALKYIYADQVCFVIVALVLLVLPAYWPYWNFFDIVYA